MDFIRFKRAKKMSNAKNWQYALTIPFFKPERPAMRELVLIKLRPEGFSHKFCLFLHNYNLEY